MHAGRQWDLCDLYGLSRFTLTLHSFIEAGHSPSHTFSQNHRHGVDRSFECFVQLLAVAVANGRQYKLREIVERVIRFYAESHSRELLSAQAFNDRLQSLLSARASPRPHSNHPEGECDIIAGNEQISRLPFAVSVEQGTNRVAAQIHVGLRFCEQHALTRQRYLRDLCARLGAKAAATPQRKQSVNEHEPEIMPGHFVFPPRIPEPNY